MQNCTFNQKFRKKSTKKTQHLINSWVEKNKNLTTKFWSLYTNSKSRNLLFSAFHISAVKSLIVNYYKILLLEVSNFVSQTQIKIVQKTLPKHISELQNMFIESFPVVIYSIHSISKISTNLLPGVDGTCFKTRSTTRTKFRIVQLLKSRYIYSTKSKKVKKNLPKIGRISPLMYTKLKKKTNFLNLALCFQLLKVCNIKTFKTRFKASSIACKGVLKKKKDFFFSEILNLRDRVLQQIIKQAVLPIIEFQADSLSFGYRSNKCGRHVIAFIYRKLYLSGILTKQQITFPKKVTYLCYLVFKGKKIRLRVAVTNYNIRRKRCYFYTYWIFCPRKKANISSCRPTHYKFLKIKIVDCFKRLSHQTVLTLIPLSSKYLHFIHVWLTTSVIISVNNMKTKLTVFPQKGLLKYSILGPLLCTLSLDGLQNYLHSFVPLHMSIYCVRYLDVIFIFGKCTWFYLKRIQKLLTYFLKKRNLFFKNSSLFLGHSFKPGASFLYSGFKFIFSTSPRQQNLQAPFFVKYSKFSIFCKSAVFILIAPKPLKRLKNELKIQLSSKNTYLPVKQMISKLNCILQKTYKFLYITTSVQIQLKHIDRTIHRLFYKYLLRKYSSTPKIYTYINKKFRRGNNFKEGAVSLLTTSDI